MLLEKNCCKSWEKIILINLNHFFSAPMFFLVLQFTIFRLLLIFFPGNIEHLRFSHRHIVFKRYQAKEGSEIIIKVTMSLRMTLQCTQVVGKYTGFRNCSNAFPTYLTRQAISGPAPVEEQKPLARTIKPNVPPSIESPSKQVSLKPDKLISCMQLSNWILR